MADWLVGRSLISGIAAEPADEADRGRHTGFAWHEGIAGGPGSLSLSFADRIKTMSVPRKLLQAAFATLPATTLRRAAAHNGIRGRDEMSPSELAERLGRDDGLNLQSYSSKFSLPELKGIAKVFGIEHRKQNKAALSYAIWSFIHEYDLNQEQGKVETLDDALARATDFQRFDAVRERIARKLTKPSVYDTLHHGEKLLWQINWLVWEVNNGGFDQYLTNSTGDYAQETIGYFKEVRATTICKLLKSIAAIFPRGIIPKDREKRCELLMKWEQEQKPPTEAEAFFTKVDNTFHDRGENLTELTLAYVRNHREDFV
jgi:hypothetical protein